MALLIFVIVEPHFMRILDVTKLSA